MADVPVTYADRKAFLAYVRKLMIGVPPNGKGYDSSFRECERKVAKSLDALIARARAEEKESCALECEAVCPPAGLYTPGELSAYEAAVQDCAAAIRARGEGGKA